MTTWEKIIDFFSHPESWRGITYFVTAAGITLDGDQANAIVATGLAVSGLIHVFAKKEPKV